MARLFVALQLPPAVTEELASVAAGLDVPGARLVPRENLHLTLAFLGSVAPERVQPVCNAVGAAVAGMVDLPTRLDELGAFPSPRRARVIWAGLADPAAGIATLARAVTEALEPLGFEPERRAFRPHVTLARLKVPRAVSLPSPGLRALPVPVDRVTLFESHLGGPSARYEALATFPFARS